MRTRSFVAWLGFALVALCASPALAIINQVDGTIVPQSDTLQSCLDKSSVASTANPAPGEGPGAINAVLAAAVTPQTFVPALNTAGRRVVQFTMVGEGAGYRNRFGWYNVGESPFTPAVRHEIFACRDVVAACDCPCTGGPRRAMPPEGTCTHWVNPDIVELDFDCFQRAGTWRGGPVAFYIMTPEQNAGGDTGDCAPASSTTHRVYSTDNTINDDGDYVHFLIYTSRTFRDSFYFGWEDLFRGGDNDFEDTLVRSVGLVPTCNPVPEVCDGRDNNCNGLVDDGLGTTTCGVGACQRTVNNCEGGRTNTCTPGAPATEVCDNLDNNCNGSIDEGVTRPCMGECGAGTQYCAAGVWGSCVGTSPQPEVCDNRDNDCNGVVDDVSRPCMTRCGTGTETCRAGAWGMCTAPQPATEVCDGVDNDCNGIIDDNVASRPCTAAELVGRCGTGTARCIGGRFVCDAAAARAEVCNGLDDNCNGMVDEMVPDGGSCGSAVGVCRAGRFVCRGGMYVCDGATSGGPETCDGLDNNCNGLVDEGDPGGGASCMTATGGAALCTAGQLHCRDGMLRCEGGTTARPEVCNCMDDNCDGRIDEETSGTSLCPGGGRCIGCTCRSPCLSGEFPCSVGLLCNRDNFCVPPMCGTELCNMATQVCVNEHCVTPCETVTCPSGQVCQLQNNTGVCVVNDCYHVPCTGAQLCRNSACVNNGCVGMTCPSGQFCRPDATGAGRCVGSCANIQCAPGQTCTDGRCAADPCAGQTCGAGLRCQVTNGAPQCVTDRCANMGPMAGRVCRDGVYVDDPCAGVTCPAGRSVVCRNGQCIDPTLVPLTRDRVVGAGGSCAVRPGASGRGAWGLAALAALGLVGRRRRRARGDARRDGGAR